MGLRIRGAVAPGEVGGEHFSKVVASEDLVDVSGGLYVLDQIPL